MRLTERYSRPDLSPHGISKRRPDERTNRTADQEEATRKNMETLGFPMGGNTDVFLMAKEKEDWTSKKGTRREGVLLLVAYAAIVIAYGFSGNR